MGRGDERSALIRNKMGSVGFPAFGNSAAVPTTGRKTAELENDSALRPLYPVYARGLVYLAKHRGAESAAEFQKILDYRGIVVSNPIGALARLQLGRAYALQASVGEGLAPYRARQAAPLRRADLAKAQTAYQDFLALWKHADPDIPILKQAKIESAKLH